MVIEWTVENHGTLWTIYMAIFPKHPELGDILIWLLMGALSAALPLIVWRVQVNKKLFHRAVYGFALVILFAHALLMNGSILMVLFLSKQAEAARGLTDK
jgi:hypothetical protein